MSEWNNLNNYTQMYKKKNIYPHMSEARNELVWGYVWGVNNCGV